MTDQWKFRLDFFFLKKKGPDNSDLTYCNKLKGGGWISIRATSSHSSDTMHRPSDPELSSFSPSCPSVPLFLLSVVQPANHCLNLKQKKVQAQVGKGECTLDMQPKLYNDHAGLYNKLCKLINKSWVISGHNDPHWYGDSSLIPFLYISAKAYSIF